MAGKYGYKPDGDKYWNVRDGEGQFAKGAGMASAVAKKISDLKLPPITGDYSAAEKKNLRAQRRKIGQKMLDNGWQPDQVQNALSDPPSNWPKLSEITSRTPTQPKEPADSVSKALQTREKAPKPAPALPKSALDSNLTLKDLKLPTIEGDDLTAQQKKNLRSQRRKLAQKMIDKGWDKGDIEEALGNNPKTWPDAKDVSYKTNFNQAAKASDPKPQAEVAGKSPASPLGAANLLKNIPDMTRAGFILHGLLNKMKDGTASPAEVKTRLGQMDKFKLSASYVSDLQDKADALAALSRIEKELQNYQKNPSKGGNKAPTMAELKAQAKAQGKAQVEKAKAKRANDKYLKNSGSIKSLSDSQLDAKIRDLQNQIETEELERTSEYKLDELRDTLTPLIQEKQSRTSNSRGVDAGARAFNAEKAKPATDSVMEKVVGKTGLNFVQEAESALSRPSITADQLQYYFDRVSSMIHRLEEPKLLLDSEEAKKRIRKLYIAYKSVVGEAAIPKFLQNNELFRGI